MSFMHFLDKQAYCIHLHSQCSFFMRQRYKRDGMKPVKTNTKVFTELRVTNRSLGICRTRDAAITNEN